MRILLITLLLVGSTGSLLCEAACAWADSRPASLSTAAAAAPAHTACHDSGAPVRERDPADSGDPCEAGCCTLLTLATVPSPAASGPDSVAGPLPACGVLELIRACAKPAPVPRAATPPGSPFRFRNPPLLI